MRFVTTLVALATIATATANADERSDVYAVQSGNVTVFETTEHGVTARFRYPSTWRDVRAADDEGASPRFGDVQVQGTPQCALEIIELSAPMSTPELAAAQIASVQGSTDREVVLGNQTYFNGVLGFELFFNERTADPFAPRAKHLSFSIPSGAAFVMLDCSVGAASADPDGLTFHGYIPVFRLIAQTLQVQR